jgi:ribokinase
MAVEIPISRAAETASVVCAGHVNWDVTLYVGTLPEPDGEAMISNHSQAGGGSASNTAAVLAGLDIDPVLLGSVGDDEYESLVRRELDEIGVDCTYLRAVSGGATTVKYLVVDDSGQVMVLANEGANEAFAASDLPAARLGDATHLHLTSQQPETAHTLSTRARNADISVSFDPGRRLGERNYARVADLADVLFLNDTEAETARERGLLDDRDGITVFKRGANGAEVRGDGETVSHPGFDVEPVDTAGAGDAFAAGFIAASLDGSDCDDALAVGNACGALAANSVGARTELSWDTIAKVRTQR